jgi:hypothetical protein
MADYPSFRATASSTSLSFKRMMLISLRCIGCSPLLENNTRVVAKSCALSNANDSHWSVLQFRQLQHEPGDVHDTASLGAGRQRRF